MTAKRKKAQELVFAVFNKLDKTGRNAERYREFFSKMSDVQFEKWAKNFMEDPEENFFLECTPYETEPSLKDIEAASKVLDIPLAETVTFRHLDGTTTQSKVPVGYLYIKRHQQIVSKKNGLSNGIRERNQKTGQVTGGSKAARITDMDNYSLQTYGADEALKELLGARADDPVAKIEMYRKINEEGFVSLQEIEGDPRKKVTLNTINTILLGAGITTDLVTDGLLLPITAETVDRQERIERDRASQRTV